MELGPTRDPAPAQWEGEGGDAGAGGSLTAGKVGKALVIPVVLENLKLFPQWQGQRKGPCLLNPSEDDNGAQERVVRPAAEARGREAWPSLFSERWLSLEGVGTS